MTTQPIRVLVAADPAIIRRGLAAMLATFNDLVLVGEACKGNEVLEFCKQGPVDVILLDLFIEGDGVAATISNVHKHYPGTQVIVLANSDEYTLVQQAVAAGSAGIILKNIENKELSAAIRQVHASPERQAAELLGHYIQEIQPHPKNSNQLGRDLTHREIEVLTFITQGLTNAQIGREIHTSLATIKSQVSSILSKLGVSTRTEATALAIKLQLVSSPLRWDGPVEKESGLPQPGGPSFADSARPEKDINLDHERPKDFWEAQSRIDPAGKALVRGKDHTFLAANPAYRALMPHPEVDPVGQAYECIWPAENCPIAWDLIQKVLDTKQPTHIQRVHQRLPDGSTRYFIVHIIPLEWAGEMSACLFLWDTSE